VGGGMKKMNINNIHNKPVRYSIIYLPSRAHTFKGWINEQGIFSQLK
jgi:hypothetical protein